jgi:uncharacterized protein YuzE
MKVNFKYDEKSDVLYASIGEKKPGISEEPEDGILIRRALGTREIIGFTIINYKRQKERGFLKNIPFFENIIIPY